MVVDSNGSIGERPVSNYFVAECLQTMSDPVD